MRTCIRYVLLTALRDRLFFGLFLGIFLASLIAAELGGTAFLEGHEMTLSFASAASRMILAVGLIVFVCFHIRTAMDSKEIDVILSRPVSRAQLVFAYWLGFALVGVLLVLPTAAVMEIIGVDNRQGFAAWVVSLLLEAWLVVAIALFCAFMTRSAVTAVMTSLGIYVLSRMMAFFVMTSDSALATGAKLQVLGLGVKAIAMVVPRLDFFSKSEWLVYGLKSNQEWLYFLGQAAVFIPLLLFASIIDFRRRQF